MMDFWNAAKGNAAQAAAQMAQGRWGTVSDGRNTDTGYQVRVLYQPNEVLSGWLPVLSPMVGAGWGIVAPLANGTQVFVVPDLGDADHGVVIGAAYSTAAMPPVPGGTPVGEGQFALVHKNGSYFLFNDDDVLLVTNRDLLATVGRNLVANIAGNGTVIATGNIDVGAPTINIDSNGQGGAATVNVTGTINLTGSLITTGNINCGAVLNAEGAINATGNINTAGTVTGHNGLTG